MLRRNFNGHLHKPKAKLAFLFSLILILACTRSKSQNIPERLDSFFSSVNAYKQINGSILVAEKGSIIYKNSFGFADLHNAIKNTDSTRYTLASVSKVFTSTAVLQLRDKGRIKLDDLFAKYFPDFPYPGITIRNLLSHTSGLPDYELYGKQIKDNPERVLSNKDILPALKVWKQPLGSSPGEKWRYSNTNFCLLALLVERISRLPFEQYVRKNIFIPSKMNNTYFQTDDVYFKDKSRAVNYEYPVLYTAKYENVDSIRKYRWRLYNASGFVGQGNVITTTGDLLSFDSALYTGKLLKSSTLAEAFTPSKLNNGEDAIANIGIGSASYGLGWFILNDTASGKIVWHTGGQPGALSIFLRNISKKQVVIMFDNAFHRTLYGNGLNAIAILNNQPAFTKKISLIQEYGSTLVEKGVDVAFCELQKLRADSVHYYLDEEDMNELGLRLLYEAPFRGHYELALEVLKLNTFLFPGSFNTFDSYAEALAKTGKKEAAIFMYKKSLELNPGSEGGKKAIEELHGK